MCKNGQILNCCHPNALMTLAEYLVDYASPETKKTGMALIERELEKIPREQVRELARQHIADIYLSLIHILTCYRQLDFESSSL